MGRGASAPPGTARRRLAFAAALLVLAFAGSAGAATRILAVGDFGVGGESERATGAAMQAYEQKNPAAVLLTLGDNDYTKSPSAFARNWQEAFGWAGTAGVRVAGVLGNHDYAVDEGAYELATLGLPERRYRTLRAGPGGPFPAAPHA